MKYKIIVAHPGRQHSFRLASALEKSGMLLFYCTTIYDKAHPSGLMRLTKKLLSSDNLKRANSRHNPDLDDNKVVQYLELGGMVEAMLYRFALLRPLYRVLRRINADRFGRKVARLAIKEKADAVIMYDSNAQVGFDLLKRKAPEIKRILDVSIGSRVYRKEIYQKEIDRSGNDALRRENSYMWKERELRRYAEEIQNTQYFLAASRFVRDSIEYSGVDRERIKIVPYGANVLSDIVHPAKRPDDAVHFLFVGNVNYNKGLFYTLKSLSDFDPKDADLTVVGYYDPKSAYLKPYFGSKNIEFTGRVTIDRVKEIYERSDVLVIQSFSEGMAQVGIEAMACGLPIICTYNSGVSDLITDGNEGFVVPPGDSNALSEKVRWFIDHRDRIRPMGEAARAVGSAYTWDRYAENIVSAINDIMEDKERNRAENGE